MTDPVPGSLIADVLAGLQITPLPGAAPAAAAFLLIKYADPDGDPSWAVRIAGALDDDELFGALSGYVEHVKRVSADGWHDFDTTRVST
jgi:hypothetical protein